MSLNGSIITGQCPRCLQERPGNDEGGLSFAPPCPHCGYKFIPEPLEPKLYVYVCPYCMKQYTGPHGHHVAGDDCATNCSHAHPDERGVTQPPLVRIEVAPVEPFQPRTIPHDLTLEELSARSRRREKARGHPPNPIEHP